MPQAEIVAKIFEIGRSTTGLADYVTWVNAQVTAGSRYLLGARTFQRYDKNFIVGVMGINTKSSKGTVAIGAGYAVKEFEIAQNPTGLNDFVTWAIANFTGFAKPAAPSLSLIAAGSLTTQGTMYVKTTYVTAIGETAVSNEANLVVTDNHELQVASPAAAAYATGWNVYISSATGTEKKQNVGAIAIGAAYTVTGALNTGSAAAPAGNGTSMALVQEIKLIQRFDEVYAYTLMSN